MSTAVLRIISTLFPAKRFDFSFFVAHSSKEVKQKALKRAADRAIKQQRKVLASAQTHR